jgi:transposase
MSEKPSSDKPVDESIPDVETFPQFKKRKNITVAYKLRILEQVEKLKDDPGAVGALLRKEGLYSSYLTTWRKEWAKGKFADSTKLKRGRKARFTELETQVAKLEAALAESRLENEQSQKIIEAQKKISEFLEIANQRVSLGKKPQGKP